MTYFNLLELHHAPNYRYVYLPLSSFWPFYRSWSLFLLKDSANFCILFLTLVRLNLALRTVSPGIFVPPVKEGADWFCPDMRQSKIETVIFGVSFVGQCFRLVHFGSALLNVRPVLKLLEWRLKCTKVRNCLSWDIVQFQHKLSTPGIFYVSDDCQAIMSSIQVFGRWVIKFVS